MQTKILGTLSAPSQWRFPLTEQGTMGSLSMDNNRTRLVMNSIEIIVEVSIPVTDDRKTRLLRCFPRYREALAILRKNTDCSPEEIIAFQTHIDAWFADWVAVYGREGCTNYTHMLSSSHVMRYMEEWKCLHRYSQQGWEALNALIKSNFFRRTNRGGLARNSEKKSKLLAIARWLQRRLMWYSGHGAALFDADSNDNGDDDDIDDSSYAESSNDGDREENSDESDYSNDSNNHHDSNDSDDSILAS